MSCEISKVGIKQNPIKVTHKTCAFIAENVQGTGSACFDLRLCKGTDPNKLYMFGLRLQRINTDGTITRIVSDLGTTTALGYLRTSSTGWQSVDDWTNVAGSGENTYDEIFF